MWRIRLRAAGQTAAGDDGVTPLVCATAVTPVRPETDDAMCARTAARRDGAPVY